jgi:hypothetical protein
MQQGYSIKRTLKWAKIEAPMLVEELETQFGHPEIN